MVDAGVVGVAPVGEGEVVEADVEGLGDADAQLGGDCCTIW
jgi:hypothetical protein